MGREVGGAKKGGSRMGEERTIIRYEISWYNSWIKWKQKKCLVKVT